MNKQDLIKEYKDYGFSEVEISNELDIPLAIVKSALAKSPKVSTERIPRHNSKNNTKFHGTDKEVPMFEALYKYTPLEINKMIRLWGLTYTAKYMGITKSDIIALKYHFGYHKPIPMNARQIITYFPHDVRVEVDKRDGRVCQRCNKELDKANLRYHKISHPGNNELNNCITLCKYCRSSRIYKHMKAQEDIFDDMDYNSLKAWISEHDPFIVRNRTYPKGKIGTWPKN